MKPALVILAAGASDRLGRCKALVELSGRSVLERLLAAGSCLDETPPLIVSGADHDRIAGAAPAGCELARNEAWSQGRSGSVLLAVRLRPARALCLAPVDVPLVPAGVFQALCRSWEDAGAPESGWLAPCLERPGDARSGRHGHPVVVGPRLLSALAGLSADSPLRGLRRWANPLLDLPTGALEILDDLDTPADLARLEKRLGAG